MGRSGGIVASSRPWIHQGLISQRCGIPDDMGPGDQSPQARRQEPMWVPNARGTHGHPEQAGIDINANLHGSR